MAETILDTPNFEIQFDPAEFSGPGELAGVQNRATAFGNGCEGDYATLCGWFGVAVGEGLGQSNRVIVTLTKNVRGAVNFGYSPNHPQMSVNPELGASDDRVLGLLVAEMSEILMSYKGTWNRLDSTARGCPGCPRSCCTRSSAAASSTPGWPVTRLPTPPALSRTRSSARTGSRRTSPEAR